MISNGNSLDNYKLEKYHYPHKAFNYYTNYCSIIHTNTISLKPQGQ